MFFAKSLCTTNFSKIKYFSWIFLQSVNLRTFINAEKQQQQNPPTFVGVYLKSLIQIAGIWENDFPIQLLTWSKWKQM